VQRAGFAPSIGDRILEGSGAELALQDRDRSSQAHSSIEDFKLDIRTGVLQLKPLSHAIFARARALSLQTTPRLGTRAADTLHIAAALELGSNVFLSFDVRQRKLAHTMKLKLNPMPQK